MQKRARKRKRRLSVKRAKNVICPASMWDQRKVIKFRLISTRKSKSRIIRLQSTDVNLQKFKNQLLLLLYENYLRDDKLQPNNMDRRKLSTLLKVPTKWLKCNKRWVGSRMRQKVCASMHEKWVIRDQKVQWCPEETCLGRCHQITTWWGQQLQQVSKRHVNL